MKLGTEEYRKALRRYNTLLWLDAPTPRQQTEMAELDAKLTAAELQGKGLRELVSDYDDALRNAGSLGVIEL